MKRLLGLAGAIMVLATLEAARPPNVDPVPDVKAVNAVQVDAPADFPAEAVQAQADVAGAVAQVRAAAFEPAHTVRLRAAPSRHAPTGRRWDSLRLRDHSERLERPSGTNGWRGPVLS